MNAMIAYSKGSKEQPFYAKQKQYVSYMGKDDCFNNVKDMTERLTTVEVKVGTLENTVADGFKNVNERLDKQNKVLQDVQIKCIKIGLVYSVLVSALVFLLTQFADKIFNI